MKNPMVIREFGASSVQGERDEMQDVYSMHHLRVDKNGVGARIHVFDGHGDYGQYAARIADSVFSSNLSVPITDIATVFGKADRAIENASIDGGATATVVDINIDLSGERTIATYWAGDSPAYLISPTGDRLQNANSRLSCTPNLHNVENQSEINRMKHEGVFVSGDYFGRLAVSRSLGDSNWYRGVITDPDCTDWQSRGPRLLVVGTDGALFSETTQEVLDDVLERKKHGASLQKIAEYITHKYASMTGDNATVVLADLPSMYEQ